ncbi:MAG: NAD(P)/FAD-dependent oxidoreductase [Acidobacteriota bacterium]
MTSITRRGFIKGAAALAPLALTPASAGARQQEPRADAFDIVVAGAGHNSLVAAGYLAKAGYRCVVLEDQPIIGGGAGTAEVTRPGFKHDLFASNHGGIPSNPAMRDLDLASYGLKYFVADPVMHISFPDRSSITVWRDFERTAREFDRINPKDGESFRRIAAEFDEVRGLLGNPERLAQHPKGNIWRRRMQMSAYDFARQLFEDSRCRAFALAAGHLGGDPPGEPWTWRSALSVVNSGRNGRPMPVGGSGALAEALSRFITEHGGMVLTKKTVTRLIVEKGRCVGVECADGSRYRGGRAVLSTIHITHLIGMAPGELWPDDFIQGVGMWKPEHAMFNVHVATTEPPKYPLAGGGTLSPCESVALVRPERLLRLEFDDAAGEITTDDLPLQIVCPTIIDPTRAPDGMHTLKINGFQPYAIKEGLERWDQLKNQVADAYLATLRRLAPNLTDDTILARYIISPVDMERLNRHFWRGSAHAGYDGPGQGDGMRPVAGWTEYRMPIPGLYQTGACTLPGGSVNGNAGRNAAAAMLRDFGGSIDQLTVKG